jgi:hypothetical protein
MTRHAYPPVFVDAHTAQPLEVLPAGMPPIPIDRMALVPAIGAVVRSGG